MRASHVPTLRQLKYLCAVAEHLHFGRAAEACFVSQSTLSTGIHELETNLGVVLVERNNKRVLVTPTGLEILKRSQQILTEVDDLVACADASREPFTGKMKLGVIPTIAPYLLPQILQQLRQKHPEFELYIREDLSASLVQLLEQGALDLLLLALPYPADNVETCHLFYDEFLLACYSKHPLAKKHPICTDDLRGQALLLLEDGHCLREHALDACMLDPTDINLPYQGSSLNTILQMVAGDIGITLVPRMALRREVFGEPNLTAQTFSQGEVHRSIGLMWRKKSPRRREFEQFANEIKSISAETN